jgi:rubrerythrin
MRKYYYCDNCGSEVILQDSTWLGDNSTTCPLCGDEDGAFVELVPEKRKKEVCDDGC